MTQFSLNDPAKIGNEIIDQFLHQGWQSLSKRDLDLLIFTLLEQDGAIDPQESNHDVALGLRITPAKVASLRKDSSARWRHLHQKNAEDSLKSILSTHLKEDKLKKAALYASERKQKEGFLALIIEHPDHRSELENVIKKTGNIPIYERNREVILIHFETLLDIAEEYDFIKKDVQAVKKILTKLFKNEKTLEQFLNSNLKELNWNDARNALREVSVKLLAGQINTGLLSLLKLAFPFLK